MELQEILLKYKNGEIDIDLAESQITETAHHLLAKKIGMKEIGNNVWVKDKWYSFLKYRLTMLGFERILHY